MADMDDVERRYYASLSKMLIDHYEEQITREELSDIDEVRNCVKLTPIIEVKFDSVYELNLQVGIGKMYTIKNISEFVKCVEREKYHSYSNNFGFIHTLGAFCEENRPLLKFVVNKMDEYMDLKDIRFNYRYADMTNQAFMPLAPRGFDEFFHIMEGRTVKFKENGVASLKKFETRDPEVSFTIEEIDDQYILSTTLYDYKITHSPENAFIITRGHIYKVSKEFKDNILVLLEGIARSSNHEVEFTKELAKRFIQSSYHRIAKFVPLSVPMELLADKAKVTANLYLDMDAQGSIIGELEFEYPYLTFNPFKLYDGPIKRILDTNPRDMVTENKAIALIKRYNFRMQGDYLILKDEDLIYNFVRKGIDDFIKIGNVSITEAIKKMHDKKKVRGRLGVRLKYNMLHIKLNEINISPEEINLIINAYRKRRKYYRIKDGSFIDIENDEMFDMADTLGLDMQELMSGKEIEVPVVRSLYIKSMFKDSENIELDDSSMREFKNIEEAKLALPQNIRANLRDYQKTGYRWLRSLSEYNFGGILADDMGLGKTLQIITLLCKFYEEGTDKKCLVVCPTSVMLNWKMELIKFAPHLRHVVVMGTVNERRQIWSEIDEYDVLITSYELLKRDLEMYKDFEYRCVVLDEAQYVKNAKTVGSKAVKSLKAETRFALTGTPIENSLAELWNIFDFIMPGYLFEYERFRDNYEAVIVRYDNPAIIERLHRLISPFILRRLKKDVLTELPEKTESILYNEMTKEQSKIYKSYIGLARKEIREELIKKYSLNKASIKILAILTRVRQICCHPALYLKDYENQSGKLEQCIELIKTCMQSGHRILLFSQFTTMLDIISRRLKIEGIEHLTLVGDTKPKERLELVEEFNESSIPVFLISLKAGGTGLNLTGADVVIHYDPWWNVSSQNQATDRTYRIGQTKNVQVFKLITKDTIEEKIVELQDRKQELTEDVLAGETSFLSKMSENEILDLFNMD